MINKKHPAYEAASRFIVGVQLGDDQPILELLLKRLDTVIQRAKLEEQDGEISKQVTSAYVEKIKAELE